MRNRFDIGPVRPVAEQHWLCLHDAHNLSRYNKVEGAQDRKRTQKPMPRISELTIRYNVILHIKHPTPHYTSADLTQDTSAHGFFLFPLPSLGPSRRQDSAPISHRFARETLSLFGTFHCTATLRLSNRCSPCRFSFPPFATFPFAYYSNLFSSYSQYENAE